MIDRKEIVKNAKFQTENLIVKNSEFANVRPEGCLNQDRPIYKNEYIEDFYCRRIPSSYRKKGRICFRTGDINSIAKKQKSFFSLHASLENYNIKCYGSHTLENTLTFVSQCMMINTFDYQFAVNPSDLCAELKYTAYKICSDVFDIFWAIRSSCGEHYLEDFHEQSRDMAFKVCMVSNGIGA